MSLPSNNAPKVVIGVSVGMAIGIALDNPAMGIGLGAAIGTGRFGL